MDTSSGNLDSLDDSTPLPELSFDDLLEPPEGAGKHLDDDDVDELMADHVNESLNTPRPKKVNVVKILENKRLAPGELKLTSAGGSNIRILSTSAGATVVTSLPAKTPQLMESKLINKLPTRPLKTMTLTSSSGQTITRIGGTTITAAGGGGVTTSAVLGGKTYSQIKTTDGKIIYLQKTAPKTSVAPITTATTTVKVPATATTVGKRLISVGGTPGTTVTQTSTAGKPVSLPQGIQKAVLSKGVTIAPTGLVKAAVPALIPLKTAAAASAAAPAAPSVSVTPNAGITVKTVTPSTVIMKKAPVEGAKPATPLSNTPIQVVRTADGKLLKLNRGGTNLLLKQAQPATPSSSSVPPVGSTIKLSPNNVVLTKSGQVVIKGPVKQLPSELKQSPTTTVVSQTQGVTATPATASPATGKMVMQTAAGKQVVVAGKNIIKLSPRPGATGAITNTSAAGQSPNTSSNFVHVVQVPGKSGVQYVRVVSQNKAGESTTNTGASTTAIGGATKLLNALPTKSGGTAPTTSTPTKFVVKQSTGSSGGNIVPLPGVQTLLSKRINASPGGSSTSSTIITPTSGASRPLPKSLSVEPARKHKLSDLNVQLRQLAEDESKGEEPVSDGSEPTGPEAKKPRYVVLTQKSKQGQPLRKVITTRPVQSSSANTSLNPSTTAPGGTRRVYKLVKTAGDSNGVKYMICNSSTGNMNRVIQGQLKRPLNVADSKLRRSIPLGSAQQLRFKQMKAAAGSGAVPMKQSLPKKLTQQRPALLPLDQQQKALKQQDQEEHEEASASGDIKPVSALNKPLFDILKPEAPPAPRRKHCNCSKSQCLKLYCDCFANGEFCKDCTCKDCFNNLEYEDERQKAIRSCLDRNPSAFKPKITARDQGDMRLHNKGCNCKRSGCLKNYCECYEAKIPCSSNCKCVGCRNMEDRPDCDLDSMDARATAARALNGSQADKHPNIYLTDDVIEATIMCMISRIVMHEKQNVPVEDTEREVIEELGESLSQIIMFAKEKNELMQADESVVA